MTAEGFVEHLHTRLTEVAAEVDRTRPQNHELIINEKGEPALKRLWAKATPVGLLQLEEALSERIPGRTCSLKNISGTAGLMALPIIM